MDVAILDVFHQGLTLKCAIGRSHGAVSDP